MVVEVENCTLPDIDEEANVLAAPEMKNIVSTGII